MTKVLELKEKNKRENQEDFGSGFYKELFGLKNSLKKIELVENLDLILENLVNIFPEIDNAVILEQKNSKYKIITSLGYDLSDLKPKEFLIGDIYPQKINQSLEIIVCPAKEKHFDSKLFQYLNKSNIAKSRIIMKVKCPYSNFIIVAETLYLDFLENRNQLLLDFKHELEFLLEKQALLTYHKKKASSLVLISEIKKLCKDKVGLEQLLIHTTNRLIDLFPKLKINVYWYNKEGFELTNNLGFEDIPEKVLVNKNVSIDIMEKDFREKTLFASESLRLWSVVFESIDKSLAIVNIVLDKTASYQLEQDFIETTLEQLKITIEHFLFYQNMIELEYMHLFISENMSNVVILSDKKGKIEYISPSIRKIAGYKPSEMVSGSIFDYVHPDDLEVFSDVVARADSKKPLKVLHRTRAANGKYIWGESAIKTLIDNNKEYLLIISQDNDGAKEAEEHLEYIGIHDALTGLPNRGQLLKGLEIATNKKQQNPQKIFALILLNLDRFKNINDSMGHKVGDELLRRVSKRLEACVYSSDLVSRIGGDEFAILLDDLPNNAEAKSVIERIQKEFSRSFFIDDNEIYVSLSMGLAFINDLKLKSTENLRNADLALRGARKLEEGYRVFNNFMLKNYNSKVNLEKDLQAALKEGQLFLVFQPMFDLIRRKVSGFEALIRWNHPTKGLISPIDFIPIAEETGIIIDIDYWVLKNAAKQLKSWNLRFGKTRELFVSINLSARNVVIDSSAIDISECIRKQGVDPHNIKLEVTEGVLMNNMRVASKVLSKLRAEGFRIQLDDFGTGYSSLSYIQKLPIDSLKIDQSFIRRMDGGTQDEAIVKAILALGVGLDLEVVAEGVETPYQLERLTEMNCDYAQGYLIAKPLLPEEVEKRFFN